MRAQFDKNNRLLQAWAVDSQAPAEAIEVEAGASYNWEEQPDQFVLRDGKIEYDPQPEYLIPKLQTKLAETDWVAAKIADIMATGTESEVAAAKEKYAQILMERADWRTEINQLESKAK